MRGEDGARAQEIVEEFGTMLEASGGSRSLGKVLGYLFLAGEPRSLDDIAVDLSVSKPTASIAVRQGLQIRLFRKVGIPGSRRDHYEIQSGAWTGAFRASLAQGQAFQGLLERAATAAANQSAAERLAEAIAFYRFYNEELIALTAKWELISKRRE
ncbi:MAG: GbsR/MarR family transcriptional regulator [Bacilli bacterium]